MFEIPFHINSTEMDLLTAVEADIVYPIAFRDRISLAGWASENYLDLSRIGRFDLDNSAALVTGKIPVWPTGERFYSQVWVKANFGGYRKSILRHITETEGPEKHVGFVDADHAVSKKRLTEIWPDAWVNLTLVDRKINRSIGSMLEKEELEIQGSGTQLNANLEFLLKLFYHDDKPLSRRHIQNYFDQVSKSFLGNFNDLFGFVMVNNADGFLTEVASRSGLKNNRPTIMIRGNL